jgi:hypothetical protein
MNGYKIVTGVDVSKNSFTATVLYDNKKENFEVKSDPVEFEMKIKPFLKKFKPYHNGGYRSLLFKAC